MTSDKQVRIMVNEAQKILSIYKFHSKNIENCLNYQLAVLNKSAFLPCSRNSHLKQEVDEQFQRAYSTLTSKQKAQFYLLNAKNIEKSFTMLETQINLSNQNTMGKIVDECQFRFEIKDENLYKNFTQVSGFLKKTEKLIEISPSKQIIDLKKFILRRSKKNNQKYCLVLEASQPSTVSKTIRFSFNKDNFEGLSGEIRNTWEQAQFQKISGEIETKQKRIITKKLTVSTLNFGQFSKSSNLINLRKNNSCVQRNQRHIDKSMRIEIFEAQQMSDSQEFFTVAGSLDTHLDQIVEQVNEHEGSKFKRQQDMINPEHAYLKHTYQQTPKSKEEPKLFSQPVGHPIFGKDWKEGKKGGLILVNQQKIKGHNDGLKYLMKMSMKKNDLYMDQLREDDIEGIQRSDQKLRKAYYH